MSISRVLLRILLVTLLLLLFVASWALLICVLLLALSTLGVVPITPYRWLHCTQFGIACFLIGGAVLALLLYSPEKWTLGLPRETVFQADGESNLRADTSGIEPLTLHHASTRETS